MTKDPICGMTLVLKTPAAISDQAENAERRDMTKRCWIGATLTLPVLVLAMAHLIPALTRQSRVDSHASRWMQFALTTPVVWWIGWTFFGLLLNPIIAGAAMSLSSVSVISNALRLRKVRL